jgi:uncharacterized protein
MGYCLLRTILTALFTLAAIAGAAVAGPYEDGEAAFSRGDWATAMQLWRPLADQGVAAAQLRVGQLYDFGFGAPQDYAEALKWYRKAADQNDASAQMMIGQKSRSAEELCRGGEVVSQGG